MGSNYRLVPIVVGAVLVIGMLFYGCQEGPFGRRQVVLISPEQEMNLGAQAFAEVLNKYRGQVLPRDHPLSKAVEGVGRQLAKSAEDPELRKKLRLQPLKFRWEFRVVDSKEVNAFCLPGGKVVFFTGILPICATD